MTSVGMRLAPEGVFFITVQHCCIRRRGYVPSTCTIERIIGKSVCVVQTDIYRVFAE
jgi:hypothetical protein